MDKKNALFFYLTFSLFILVILFFLINPRLPINLSFFFLLGIFIFLLSFLNTDYALVILIFSMMLSPELKIGESTLRPIAVRAEDILLFIIFFGWLARVSLHKELGLLRITPINISMIFYLLVCIVSSLLAIFSGRLEITNSFFFLLKYAEYFLLYFMVANYLDNRQKAYYFLFFIFLTAVIISIYGWFQIPTSERISSPFEGQEGEPNTLAGYLLLMMGLVLGFFIHYPKLRILLSVIFVLFFVPFMYTLSRGAWLAFFVLPLSVLLFSKRIKLPFFAFSLLALFVIFTFPEMLPLRVQNRLKETFTPGRRYELLGREIILDESASERLDTWRNGLAKFLQRPIFGHGVPDAAVVDNQYIRVFRETGMIGFLAFIWLLLSLFRTAINNYWLSFSFSDKFGQSLTLGFLMGFMSLLLHGFSAATFIIIRIMEPFWFLAAIVAVWPQLTEEKKHAAVGG